MILLFHYQLEQSTGSVQTAWIADVKKVLNVSSRWNLLSGFQLTEAAASKLLMISVTPATKSNTLKTKLSRYWVGGQREMDLVFKLFDALSFRPELEIKDALDYLISRSSQIHNDKYEILLLDSKGEFSRFFKSLHFNV